MYCAVITGITGQDGSYLTELLLKKGYTVFGLVRRCSMNNNIYNIRHLLSNPSLKIHYGDITDASSFCKILIAATELAPERIEVYNLAAQSQVQRSFEMPEYTLQVNGTGVLHILEAIRLSPFKERIRFYQASTSELFGKAQEVPQVETTPFYPRTPYGVAKLYGFWITKNYRESYGIYAVNGILYNHESPRRGEDFVTRKITKAVADIRDGKQEYLSIGNLDAFRDWGHARDYVMAMWKMLQADDARDWVVATGVAHSVREFVEVAFSSVGISIVWKGAGIHETGMCAASGKVVVRVNHAFFRAAEGDHLIGDSSAIREELGWRPETTFHELVKEMIENDMQ
jgi:GDPmannose 4,6-dehydratase